MFFKKIKEIFKNPVFVLFTLLFFIHLPFLDQTYLLHDERDIILSGYSIAKTGKDLFGNFFPLRFENISPSNPLYAIYYSAVWHLFFPKSIFFGRLAYVFISSFLIFLVYFLVFKITKNEKTSLLTAIIFCFNPWIFHITRLALDIPLALTMLLAGIIFYLNKKSILAYFLFFLSSFTYQGYKILIPPLLFYLELFFLLKKESAKKQFFFRNFINVLFIVFLVFSTLIIDKNVATNRKNEFIFLNTNELKKTVDFKRGSSKTSLSISKFFDNKLTIVIDHLIANIFKNYNPSYLFKNGDPNAINGNISAGQFFQIFIIFYFLGFLYLGSKGKKVDFFILGLTLIGIIPAIIKIDDEPSFSIRGSLSAVGFSYLLSLGLIYYLTAIKNKIYKNWLNLIILMFFSLNIITFFYNYFFRRPILISEIFNENQRQLVNFLDENPRKRITIFHSYPKDLYLSLLLLKGRSEDISNVQNNLRRGLPYHWYNYEFSLCNNKLDYLKQKNIIVFEGCLPPEVYEKYEGKVINKVRYKDYYSNRTAYFIIY